MLLASISTQGGNHMVFVDKALSKEIMITNRIQNKVLELEVQKKAVVITK